MRGGTERRTPSPRTRSVLAVLIAISAATSFAYAGELANTRQDFANHLIIVARARAGRDDLAFFAIARRGMDWYDARAGATADIPVDLGDAGLERINAEPTDDERSPHGRARTAERLPGFDYVDGHATQRKAFVDRLLAISKQRSNGDMTKAYAIARSGLDWYDSHAGPNSERVVEPDDATFDQIVTAAKPLHADSSADGRALTSLRLGISPLDGRVVGGSPVQAGVAEEVVFVGSDSRVCTGTVLSSTAVLTAAHCVCDLNLRPTDGPTAQTVIVSNDVSADSVRKYPIDVTKTVMYQGYQCHDGLSEPANTQLNIQNGVPDLALISVGDGDVIEAPVASLGQPDVLEQVLDRQTLASFVMYGFGCTIDTGTASCPMDHARAKYEGIVRPSYQCSSGVHGVPPDPMHDSPDVICERGEKEFVLSTYGEEVLTDTCRGDSGGPVFLLLDGQNADQRALVGVTSRGLARDGSCGYGGIYTKVANDAVFNWLRQHGIGTP